MREGNESSMIRKIFLLVISFFLVFGQRICGDVSSDVGKVSPMELSTALGFAVWHASRHGVGAGYCGRGVLSILRALNWDLGLEGADGHDWEKNLSRAGWVPYYCSRPQDAPYGSVLVYMSDIRLYGKNLVGTRGGRWGHVEFVSRKNGRKVYLSDAVRYWPGGTVPFNFTKRAWVPPWHDLVVNGAVREVVNVERSLSPQSGYRLAFYDVGHFERFSEGVLMERLKLASLFFGGEKGER